MNQKFKLDAQKPRWDLVDLESMEGVAKVLEYGTRKYSAHSWKNVEPERYFGALMRHLTKHQAGEEVDKESGLTHLDHAMCNLMFLVWFHKKKDTNK